jgi:polyhydroxyalkanoate synthase
MTHAPQALHASLPTELVSAWRSLASEWARWWEDAARGAFGTGPVASSPAFTPTSTSASSPTSPASDVSSQPPWIPGERFVAITRDYQARLAALWQAVASTPPGRPLPEIVEIPPNDKRFRAAAWRESPFHSFVVQAYLLHAAYLTELAASARLPEEQQRQLRFITRQYVDALAPTNFPATNPEVIARAIDTRGESFVAGLANLVGDVRRGRISMSDDTAFEVGRNLATTPGDVVFRNELIELIQYAPSTPSVYARPLVIVPPCINKYYILDLSPSNSFVRHAVAQGHRTFIISWRNIPAALGHLTWDDYLQRGVLQAIDVARAICNSKTVNTLGFCVGGTLLACALAVLAARRESTVESATFLTTMLDFDDPGDIGVYVTRQYLAAREPALLAGQRMNGAELATAFATLRPNDLVWNYVVGNYLKGQTPPAFDLLHWNADSANLPGPMYAYYLREFYLENRLRDSGALRMLGEEIDVSSIQVPAHVVATRDDHIVPWRTAYRTVALLGGETTFTLGASGHIAGIVNPVAGAKRDHWTNARPSADPDDWLQRAELVPGSWWTAWSAWIAPRSGARRRVGRARTGSARFPPLDPAPGTYVTEKVD